LLEISGFLSSLIGDVENKEIRHFLIAINVWKNPLQPGPRPTSVPSGILIYLAVWQQ